MPDGGFLVSDRLDILRYTSTGLFVRSYNAPGHDNYFGMSVGIGGTSVWAVDRSKQDVVNIDLTTGNVITTTPLQDDLSVRVGSVIVAGGYRAAACPDGNERVSGAHPERVSEAHRGSQNGRSGQER